MNTEIEKINEQQYKLEQKKKQIEIKEAKEYFSKYTYEDLEKLWNKDTSKAYPVRCDILYRNPYVNDALNKLDSHGGMRWAELFEEVVRDDFNESEWLDMNDLYSVFLKKSEEN